MSKPIGVVKPSKLPDDVIKTEYVTSAPNVPLNLFLPSLRQKIVNKFKYFLVLIFKRCELCEKRLPYSTDWGVLCKKCYISKAYITLKDTGE